MLQAQKFSSVPREVVAVRVTPQNLREVAAWCGGKIISVKADGSPGPRYILVDVRNPLSPRQTKAYKGDWVLKAEKGGFKVYLDPAFQQSFVVNPDAENVLIDTGLEKRPTKKKRPPKKTAVGDAMKRAQAAAVAKNRVLHNGDPHSISFVSAENALPGNESSSVTPVTENATEGDTMSENEQAGERQDPADAKRLDVAVDTEPQPTENAPEQPAETTSVTVEQSTPTDS